jgi:hypothetical protein
MGEDVAPLYSEEQRHAEKMLEENILVQQEGNLDQNNAFQIFKTFTVEHDTYWVYGL